VYWYFKRWERDQVTDTMLTVLREHLRVQQGRNPQPSAGIIDSQSVKGADTVGRDSRGYDAAKRINGRKRFIVTDTLGLLIVVVVLAASVQDRDGAKTTLLHMQPTLLVHPARFEPPQRSLSLTYSLTTAGRRSRWRSCTGTVLDLASKDAIRALRILAVLRRDCRPAYIRHKHR
jgi:hypothetical protein